jgi:hypothetical protein
LVDAFEVPGFSAAGAGVFFATFGVGGDFDISISLAGCTEFIVAFAFESSSSSADLDCRTAEEKRDCIRLSSFVISVGP